MRYGRTIPLFISAVIAAVAIAPGLALAENSAQFMYRLYNPNSGEHVYTASEGERRAIIWAGWQDEGVGWIAPTSGNPVYRLYNPNGGDHHYTASSAERDLLVDLGWSSEGIGWYSDTASQYPIYRQYNPNAVSGSHNYTSSIRENNALVRAGWNAEGIGWYGLPQASNGHVVVTQEGSGSVRSFMNEGWQIDFGDVKNGYKTVTVPDAYPEYAGERAYGLPVTVTNLTGATASTAAVDFVVYEPDGSESKSAGYFFGDSLENLGTVYWGESAQGYLYFLDCGPGDYTISFTDYSNYNRHDMSPMCHDLILAPYE